MTPGKPIDPTVDPVQEKPCVFPKHFSRCRIECAQRFGWVVFLSINMQPKIPWVFPAGKALPDPVKRPKFVQVVFGNN